MSTIRVLIIEDNPGDVRLLREYLSDSTAPDTQYHLFSAAYLADGLQILRHETVDIVLLDLGLPDSQGLDTFHRLHAAYPDLPVVLLTGSQQHIAALAMQAGAQDYLSKDDVNQALLERALRYAIERQRTARALQASEQRLRKIIDQNSIAILVVSLPGEILFTNPAANALFGCATCELLGQPFGYPILAGQNSEIVIPNRQIGESITEMSAAQITWEDQPAYLVSLVDITARKNAEAEQRQVRDNLNSILESTREGFFTLNEDFIITYYNPAAEALLKRPARRVLGRSLLESFPELSGSVLQEKFTQALQQRTVIEFEIYFDVEPFTNWYQLRLYPFNDGIAIYFQVITDQKRAIEERQAEMEISQAFAEMYLPLISPKTRLVDIASEITRRACQLTHSALGLISFFDAKASLQARVLAAVYSPENPLQPLEETGEANISSNSAGQYEGPFGWLLNIREEFSGRCPAELQIPGLALHTPDRGNDIIVIPISLEGRLLGQVAVARPACGYHENDLKAMHRLAEFYGLILQRWEVENELRQARDESQRLFEAERQQHELSDTMREVISILVSATDQETIFQRLLEQVGRVVPFDEAVIYMVEDGYIKAVHWLGYEKYHPGKKKPDQMHRIRDYANLNYMLTSGKPVLNADTLHHPNWITHPETRHIRSYAGVPILVQGQVIGFLNTHHTQPGFYNERHLELLSIFGDEVGIALENARLLAETRHRVSELEVINKVSSSLRAAESLDETLPVFLDGLLEVTGTPSGAIFLADPVTADLILTLRRGIFDQFFSPPIPAGRGIIGQVFQTGQTYFTPDFAQDPRLLQAVVSQVPPGISGLCLPLRTARETFGVVVLAFAAPRQPNQDEQHLIETLVDMAGNTFHRMRLHEETETRLRYLSALRTIDLAIATSFDLRVTLNVLLEQTISQLQLDAADILLFNPVLQTLEFAAGRGFYTRAIEETHLHMGQGYAGQAALENRMISLPDLRDPSLTPNRLMYLAGERFVTYFGIPLVIKGEIKGVLELFQRSLFRPAGDWLNFLEALAGQAAIAIDIAQLFERLQRSQLELAMAYDYTLEGWSRALDLRDRETENHTERVTEMCVRLARRMGIDETELVHVRRGALLHDIGKMGVPDEILLKPGPLTEAEWGVMRKHPEIARELLSPIEYLRPALDIPYCHHEHWNGGGYPRGLKGEQIPKAARLFFVIDVWDALSHERPYKKAWPQEKVFSYLREQAGRQLDPHAVDEFIHMLEEDRTIAPAE